MGVILSFEVPAMGPRRAKASHPEFLSDAEDGESIRVHGLKSASQDNLSADDQNLTKTPIVPDGGAGPVTYGPPPPKVSEISGNHAVPPHPAVTSGGGGTLHDLVNLVSILQQANASLKGKIDDTGRFELKFGLNRQRKKGSRRDSEDNISTLSRSSTSSSMESGTPSKSRKTIAWKRYH